MGLRRVRKSVDCLPEVVLGLFGRADRELKHRQLPVRFSAGGIECDRLLNCRQCCAASLQPSHRVGVQDLDDNVLWSGPEGSLGHCPSHVELPADQEHARALDLGIDVCGKQLSSSHIRLCRLSVVAVFFVGPGQEEVGLPVSRVDKRGVLELDDCFEVSARLQVCLTLREVLVRRRKLAAGSNDDARGQ